MIRRVERAALSAPFVLKVVTELKFGVSEIISNFSQQFLPLLRYHNPKLSWSFDEKFQDLVQMTFTDSTKEVIKLEKIIQSHHLMEKILFIDSQKHSLKDKYHL